MENCNGCPMTRLYFSTCYVKVAKKEDECPCKECLVKAICNRVCDDYRDLYIQEKDSIQYKEEQSNVCRRSM